MSRVASMWIQVAVTVAVAVISLVKSPAWLQLVGGVVFLVVVLGTAAVSLADAIVGPDAGLDLRATVAAVLGFMAVMAAGALYLGLQVKLKAFELVLALAVLAVAMNLAAFAFRRGRVAPQSGTPHPARIPGPLRRPSVGQVALSVVAATSVVAAVVIAVTSTQSADARHEFTALGIHSAGGRSLPGYDSYSINVISHQTSASRYILTIKNSGKRTERRIRVGAGSTVTETVQVPKNTAIQCTLARVTSPSQVYRSVRVVPKAARINPTASGR